MTAPYVLIVNPSAGRRAMRRAVQTVAGELRRQGREVGVQYTARAGQATLLARGVPAGTPAVLVVGGDGTVREVAEGLLDRAIPLAVLPAGTENLVARQLGWSPDPGAAVATLLAGSPRRIDVGWAGQGVFLAVAGVGFDAEVVLRVARWRRGHITQLDYLWPLWRTLWEHRFCELCVIVDGHAVFEGRGLAIAGNMPRYAIGLRILQQADFTDGRLDVCVFPCRHAGKLLLHALRACRGHHVSRGDAVYAQGRRIQIYSQSSVVPVELDGDSAGHLPLELEVRREALVVLLPPPGKPSLPASPVEGRTKVV